MSTTSAASSTLSRPRAAILVFAAVASAYATYYLYSTYSYEAEIAALPGQGLTRSNAVRRRRRATTTDDPSLFVDDQIENDGAGNLVARTLTDGETVIDDGPYQDDYGWRDLPTSYQRSGQNIVQLLFRVSEDATRRNAYVHRGCACNSCGTVPIRGIRYRCANCADYDLCENCESQGVHHKAHIFYKIKVPAPAFGPRHIQPVWYTGDPSFAESQLPKAISTKLSRETGFERPELDAYWEQWTYMANTDWRDDPDDIHLAMDRRTFERCLVPSGGYRHAAPSLIFDRMFAFYDTNKDDLIGFSEYLHGIAYRKKRDRLRKVFEGYDIDEDGYVDRKDFLRIFRSYYVLYRQMHRDMLAGMEDQTMGMNEAHRLVSSRQPLSSAFGQDGRWPRGPDPRTGEGKVVMSNGDEDIVDGKGVMTESSTDTGNREDVFRRNVQRVSRNRTDRDGYHQNSGYWETMLNPPETIEQMPAVLRNLELIRGQVQDILQADRNQYANAPIQSVEHDSGDESAESGEDHSSWPPASPTIIEEDVEAVEGPGVEIADVPRSSRRAVVSHALHRRKADRQIYERWQRRQFYTDEEEGAVPPSGWKEEDDLLARAGLGESSKTPPRPTLHSRSSSKVRFAEDMDDFDTRSNPSTSSRSVPERWGGIDIPDAEKDAGKEILFQVTQQAFNELLDPLFKDLEDLAVEAAATNAEREKHRHLYNNHQFEEWAVEREKEERKTPPAVKPKTSTPLTTNPVWPSFPEVEVREIRERSLSDLLAATGYRVETDDEDENEEAKTTAAETGSSSHNAGGSDETPVTTGDDGEALQNIAQSTPPLSTPPPSEANSPPYRDPTLPQFRPNSDSSPSYSPLSAHPPEENFYPVPVEVAAPTKADEVFHPTALHAAEAVSKGKEAEVTAPEDVTQLKDRTYLLWKCDKAEEEAEMRGGWGRLNFKEFEVRVKRCEKEGKGAQMDYLGSWIEFCIP